MLTQRKTMKVIAFTFIFFAFLVASFYILFNNIQNAQASWENYIHLEMDKSAHLNQAIIVSGYGGFIHNFKNAVIRRDYNYLEKAESHIKQTISALDRYLSLTPEHINQVLDIQYVIGEYQAKLPILKEMIASGASVTEIDEKVKVDDTRAIAAFRTILHSAKEHPLAMLQKTEQSYSSTTYKLLVILNFLIIVSSIAIAFIYYLYKKLAIKMTERELIIQCAPNAILSANENGIITTANHEAMKLFGFNESGINKISVDDLVPSDVKSKHQALRNEFQQSDRIKPMSQRNAIFHGKKLSGDLFPAKIAIATYSIDNKKHSIVIINDLTEELKHKSDATTDPLTKLANRRAINQRLIQALAQEKRHHIALSICLFDIDHFKSVNDQHGHLAGDEVLQQVARVMQENIREVDFIGRWGGEEFIAILTGTGKQGALEFAEKIRNEIKVQSQTKRFPVAITISAGVTLCDGNQDIKTALNNADKALYRSKHNGRNCVSIV
ncbi:diguanylate cyclase domain-containing protein [Motilimonas cestriensis]|uniref:diguanylate cyclase domain-containing protein n=1 Tax=Motilimonas cestriensis TaxID=2742685 RepID=UPI003DA61C61